MRHSASPHLLLERWGRGLRFLAAAWFLLLIYAWLRRNAGPVDVLLFGALPTALYWTVAQVLMRWRQHRR